MTDSKAIVRSGYDLISYAYREDGAPDEPYRSWLQPLDTPLSPGAKVLDLGCGCGIPASRILAERYRVTGVDLSPVQIERARKLVPAAEFLCADMTALDFEAGRFSAIISLFAIIHVPVAEQPELFSRMVRWLAPGGWLLLIVGHRAWTGTEADWLGVPGGTMYWSHANAATYRRWLAERGCRIVEEQFIPEDNSGHTLLLAQHGQ
jgi:SAM-dependent methyltransferase